jgi:hypothetical protein
MSVGECDERNRLLLEYRAATERYSAAVAELTRNIGISSLDEYLKLHQAGETARACSNEARERVAHHIAGHHCDTSK